MTVSPDASRQYAGELVTGSVDVCYCLNTLLVQTTVERKRQRTVCSCHRRPHSTYILTVVMYIQGGSKNLAAPQTCSCSQSENNLVFRHKMLQVFYRASPHKERYYSSDTAVLSIISYVNLQCADKHIRYDTI